MLPLSDGLAVRRFPIVNVLPPCNVRDDAVLTAAANDALAADVTVPTGVEAVARNGNLTLTGMVQYGSECATAERAVSWLLGLRGSRNEIEDTFDVDPADVKQQVKETLERTRWFLITATWWSTPAAARSR
jgi:hypothetical protein